MPAALPVTIWANHRLEWGRQTYVMGVINVTPDSFSGDGIVDETLTPGVIVARAVSQAQQFVAEGATIIDVGGESTPPNFAPISAEQELARLPSAIGRLDAVLPQAMITPLLTLPDHV